MASTLYNIFNSLSKAAKATGIAHVYLTNRPKLFDTSMGSFVVISLPARLYRDVKGNDDFMVSTTGTFMVGVVAKKDGTPNIQAQTDLVQKFMDLFPISDDYISATNPQIIMRGDDETGYQITSIMFDIRTKVNQYLKG